MSQENYASTARSDSQQQIVSVEFDVVVKDWWISGGRMVVPKEYRQYFPRPGESIVLIDYEGRMYRSKMHNLWQGVDVGRIDGIKPFYRNHSIIFPDTTLHVKLTGKDTAIVLVSDRPSRQPFNKESV
ncbi:MAG TPA: hypothetical protein VJN71_07465 [Nitrososphaerales archaeon]|nr:hypothetical protein [Nitrososphaerales archaeon]